VSIGVGLSLDATSTTRREHGDDQSKEEESSDQARTGHSARPKNAEEAIAAPAPLLSM
jgi:hypothetical protein